MPGRRGEQVGLDRQLLPLTFRKYVVAFAPEMKDKIPSIPFDPELKNPEEKILEIAGMGEQLFSLFNQLMLTGGFPRPINSFLKAGKVEAYVYELHRDSIIGDVTRIGKRESYLPPAFRSQKKIYFKDPFIFQALWSWTRGILEAWKATMDYLAIPPNKAVLVESIVASHLKNKFGSGVFYWKPDHEVDFLIFREDRIHQLIEVKYQEKIRPGNFRHLKKAGKGILLSKTDFRILEGKILVIPAHLFLASL